MSEAWQDKPWSKDWPGEVPHTVEIPEIGLGDLLRDAAQKYSDQKAIVFLDSVLTYGQLDDMVDRMATSLAGLGLKKGDVVAIMLPNSHQFVIAFYACQRLGVTVTTINPTYKPMEVKHQLNDSGAKALVVLDSVYESPGKILADTKVEHLIGTNVVDLCGFSAIKVFLGKLLKKIPTGTMPADALKFPDLLKVEPNPPKVEINPAEDIAVLQYTGGTTGIPKGAMLTAKNLTANVIQGASWLGGAQARLGLGGGAAFVPRLRHDLLHEHRHRHRRVPAFVPPAPQGNDRVGGPDPEMGQGHLPGHGRGGHIVQQDKPHRRTGEIRPQPA